MVKRNTEQKNLYLRTYYREHREEIKEYHKRRYAIKKDEINAKAREKRRAEKERRTKIDSENGVWDF